MDREFPVLTVNNDISFMTDMISDARLTAIVPEQKYVVLDSFRFFDKPNSVYYAYFWLERELQQFVNLEYSNTVATEHAVNFIINKKQINRYLTIKLVELYNLNASYSWSGAGADFDLSSILTDIQQLPIDKDSQSFLLAPITLAQHWIDLPGKPVVSDSSIADYNGNLWAWSNGLDRIISRAAVSLITESVQDQHCAVYTEKTAYSVLGLTFPLWVGGYAQADEWSRIGFDTFDDVIDHSYQYYPTLVERCWHAIHDNLNLLQNLDQLSLLRQQNLDRLIENRRKILANTVGDYNNHLVSQWPEELIQAIKPLKTLFSNPAHIVKTNK